MYRKGTVQFINESFEAEIRKVFKGLLPEKPSVYVYALSCIDESYCKAPSNSVLNIIVRVPHLQRLPISWNEQTQKGLYQLCLNTLSRG